MIRNKEPKTDKCLEANISLWDMLTTNQSLLQITNLSKDNLFISSDLPCALQVLKLHITFLQGGPNQDNFNREIKQHIIQIQMRIVQMAKLFIVTRKMIYHFRALMMWEVGIVPTAFDMVLQCCFPAQSWFCSGHASL